MTCSGDDEMPPRVSPVSPATAKAAVSEMRIGTRVSIKGLQGPKHLPEASRHLCSLMHLQPSFAGESLWGPNTFRETSQPGMKCLEMDDISRDAKQKLIG